jgi:dipeptidyl aminopeptidase/acylaminoacyl peptidase
VTRPTVRFLSLVGASALASALAVACAVTSAGAQRTQLTTADYDRAVKMLGQNVNTLVVGGNVQATWLPDGRFWYRAAGASGATATTVYLVDGAKKTRTALDNTKLAAGLATASASTVTPATLGYGTLTVSDDAKSVSVDVGTKRYTCALEQYSCAASGDAAGGAGGAGGGRGGRGGGRAGGAGGRGAAANAVPSPDGKRAAFIKDNNLWVRDVASGAETQLTTDGVKDFGYATDNAGWVHSDRAILLWSPDSKKIATNQQDERHVGEMYLVKTNVGHPELKAWKYPLPGDSVIQMIHHVVIDVDAKQVIRLKMPADPHRGTIGDNITMADYNWSPDGSQLVVASTTRDHKASWLSLADAKTGDVKKLFEEKVATHFESVTGWRVLWGTKEIVWYSQRDDWGNLYLYDLTTGALKNRITTGEGPVNSIVRIDEPTRTLFYTAMGREKGQDPYLHHLYRVGLDGKNATSLTPDDGDHTAQLSADGKWIVDTYSKADAPPVVNLRDGAGKLVMPLEKADISKLLATGWKAPIPFSVKAADGKTDIYGQLFRPSNFDPSKKYPIINNAYPGPQTGSVGGRMFSAAHGDRQALAELGFIVVTIDGRGTPGRSKSFHDAYYGAMGRDNTLPDQVAGMKALATQYSWIDIDRAAMWGHSGGGFITADALFRYPDFFKVGISESGNHDQRNYEDDWGERYQGLLVKGVDGGADSYNVEANQTEARNLKGHLLLAHGTLDDNVPPDNTWLVVDALIKANKDFDLLMIPNAAHGYGAASNYMMRRRWDYFVRWLLNAEPPKNFEIK